MTKRGASDIQLDRINSLPDKNKADLESSEGAITREGTDGRGEFLA